MATRIYGTEGSEPIWGMYDVGALTDDGVLDAYDPWPIAGSVVSLYLNKCVDGITGEWHLWTTFFQDLTGVYYTASGGQQFDPSTYKVEAVIYGREQL